MSDHRERSLSAAGIEFDPDSGDVRGPRGTSRLAPQPAALLAFLSRRAGDIVTRDELKDHLWPGGRVEFDQGIAFALREVRKALEEVGADPSVVETLPRRGLRLRAPAGDAEAPTIGGSPSFGPHGPDASARRPATAGRSRWSARSPWMAATLVVVLVVAIVGGLRWAAVSAGPPVLVVFPYASGGGVDGNGGGGPADVDVGALGEAVVAALTSALAGEAGVVGPAGVTALTGPDDVDGARSTLGACLVLSGSVRAFTPDSLVVFTQIVRTSDRVHVWAERDTVPAGPAAGELAARVVEGARGAVAGC